MYHSRIRALCAIAALVLAAAAIFTLSSCGGGDGRRSTTFTSMDTVMTVTLWDSTDADGSFEAAKQIASALDGELSVTEPTSAVARANAGERVALSDGAADLCRRTIELCRDTGGALDVTVYPLVRAWGFTTDEAPDPRTRVPEQSEIEWLLSFVGYRGVTISDDGELSLPDGTMIDFGAVAKGYAADLIAAKLRERGEKCALIDLGGTIRTVGEKADGSAWTIGVASPSGEGIAAAFTPDAPCVVTSGSYERYFEAFGKRYCHIIDPKTGYPADNGLLSVTVIGDSGLECDALSTALFVLGEDGAIGYWREHGGFEMILISDRGVSATAGVAPSVKLAGEYEGGELTVIETAN